MSYLYRNKSQISADIYIHQKNNLELRKDSLYRQTYARRFFELRKQNSFFVAVLKPMTIILKDYIADDGCYMSIYWIDNVKYYSFKKICSRCSSLIYFDSMNVSEFDMFLRWNLTEMNEFAHSVKDKSGVTQVTRIKFFDDYTYHLYMFTYSGF